MESHHYIWGYRMIRHRQIPISMPDNAKPIVTKYLLFTEVWNLKSVWFLLCTENGTKGLRKKWGVSTVTCINYWPIAIKRTSYLAHVWKMWGMKFQENPENGGLDTAENELFLLLFLINRDKVVPFVTHAWRVKRDAVKFIQWKPIYSRKVLRSPCLTYWPIATKLSCF